MGTHRNTVSATFPPDMMQALSAYHAENHPGEPMTHTLQELVAIGLHRSAESGAAAAARVREVRRLRAWGLRRLAEKLRDMVDEVDQSILEDGSLSGEENRG